MSETAVEQKATVVESLESSSNETKDINYYKDLCLKLKDEAEKKKVKQEKFNALQQEKAELEKERNTYKETIQQLQEAKLKENEDYKSLNELKEQELAKLKSEYEPKDKELEKLRALKAKVLLKAKAKRDGLLNEIRAISKEQQNAEYINVARTIKSNTALATYLKQISQQGTKQTKETIPTFNGKPSINTKLAGEVTNPKSLSEWETLYKTNKGLYNQLLNNKKGK